MGFGGLLSRAAESERVRLLLNLKVVGATLVATDGGRSGFSRDE